jgi:hypothetical protein
MKFVTVMDMWLLLLNIVMMGGLFYFGRKVLANLARIVAVNDRSIENPERQRITKLILAELETQQQMLSMGSDRDVQMTIDVLKDLLDKINRK